MQYNPADGIDLFSTYFKQALSESFELRPFNPSKILVLSEGSQNDAASISSIFPNAQIEDFVGNDSTNWSNLKEAIEKSNPELIVTERLFLEEHKDFAHSLGVYVEAISQTFNIPLLLLGENKLQKGRVVVGFESKVSEPDIINKALAFTNKHLLLAHIIDEGVFKHFAYAIDRVPSIVYSEHEAQLKEQLNHYANSLAKGVSQAVAESKSEVEVKALSEIGIAAQAFRRIIENEKPALLVFQSKDHSQLAMHGLGHAMAVEFNELPILLF